MDHLPPDLQDTCFLTANEVAEKLACIVAVSMREERFYRAKSTGVLDAYHTNGFHLTSPVIKTVIQKRLIYIFKQLSSSSDRNEDFNISTTADLDTVNAFLQICFNELRRDGSHLQTFLSSVTHGDVRQALFYFKKFLTSGYTNVHEFARDTNWKFQKHQIIRPMMVPDRFFYDERLSNIPNVYQIRSEGNTSHFTTLRILWYLNGKSFDKKTHGFIDAKYLVQEFQVKYAMKQDCVYCLDVLLAKALIEANNRLENYSEEVDQIRITPFGRFMLDSMCMEFTYLDLVSLDCGIFDETLSNFCSQSALNEVRYFRADDFMNRIHSRIERVRQFISYLAKVEQQEFRLLSLGSSEKQFAPDIEAAFKTEESRVLHSAKNKELREHRSSK
jgi:hypothetical protein